MVQPAVLTKGKIPRASGNREFLSFQSLLFPNMMARALMNFFDTAFRVFKSLPSKAATPAADADKKAPGEDTTQRKAQKADVSAGIPHYNKGMILERRGNKAEAIACYRDAIRAAPEYFDAHSNLARLLCEAGDIEEAIRHSAAALRLRPNSPRVHNNLATALYEKGRWAEAAKHYTSALRLSPDDHVVHENLKNVLDRHSELDGSESFQAAKLLLAQLADKNFTRGFQLLKDGSIVEALNSWRAAARFDPNWAEVLNNLAWILATHPEKQIRNGKEAVGLAQRAVEIAGDKAPRYLDTLAAAHAECGNFDAARKTIEKALAIVRASGPLELAEKLPERLKLYQSCLPFRDSFDQPAPAPSDDEMLPPEMKQQL